MSLRRIIILLIINFVFCSSISFTQQWGNYTFYSPVGKSKAYLLDSNRNDFHTWNLNAADNTGYSCYLLPGGSIIRTIANIGNKLTGGGMTGRIQKSDYDGKTLWNFTYSTSTYCLHHDICPLPNGNVLMISYDVRTATEVSAAGCTKNITMWSDKVIEVKPTGLNTGEIVWEWKFWDHLCQNVDSKKNNYVKSLSEHPELLNINYKTSKDWIHMNGIDYNEELNQIVISSHNLNEMYVIDHSTTTAEAAGHTGGNSGKGGDFLYRWGNPLAYNTTGTANFKVVHDAHWIPNGYVNANYLVGFNNNGISSIKSSVDMFYPPYDGYNYKKEPTSAFLPTTYDKRHSCNGHTTNEGNSHQLPNGNMLVCIAQSGLIYEVDSTGNMLWSKQATSGMGNMVSQAFKYTECYVNGTIAEKPVITKNNNLLNSSYGKKYQWFYNGAPIKNAIDKSYEPKLNGKYYVQIINDEGCESHLSNPFYISNLVSVDNLILNNNLLVYPNPSNGIININSKEFNSEFTVKLFDYLGNILLNLNNQNEIDISKFENGMYYLKIYNSDNKEFTSKIILIK